jgi:class 3 adenylate cyclase
MDEKKKHIDELVESRNRNRDEFVEICNKIASSAMQTVVAFVDLAESTQMKQDREPEEWLGYVYKFIRRVGQLAGGVGGTVVKRIGDELMVTFKDVQASERFVDSLIADKALQMYRYKIALDFGNAYHFRFIEHLPDDPYGPVVDRCARIAKIAAAGVVLCASEYLNQLGNTAGYVSMGRFALRGFSKPEELFARSLVQVDSDDYLKPLLSAVNEQSQRVQGYRLVGRELTTAFVREFGKGKVRPFLARELLNVPKLPYSPREFDEVARGAVNDKEKEREFYGYFVEWEGAFESYRQDDSDITLQMDSISGIIEHTEALLGRTRNMTPRKQFVGRRLIGR